MTEATPAADQIFKLCNESKKQYLPEEQEHKFHHTVAKLMFMSARENQDIHMVVALITTRVNKPDKCGCVKLKHVLK